MPQNVFVGDVAKSYDAVNSQSFSPAVVDAMLGFLADLAGGSKALEFAIGTGRVALPLNERGIEVHGIEISEHMVAELRAKPRGADLAVTIGDMAADATRRNVRARVLGLQHHQQPPHASRTGRVFRQRGRAPRFRWLLRGRSRSTATAPDAAR